MQVNSIADLNAGDQIETIDGKTYTVKDVATTGLTPGATLTDETGLHRGRVHDGDKTDGDGLYSINDVEVV